jgi:hypothetical protein
LESTKGSQKMPKAKPKLQEKRTVFCGAGILPAPTPEAGWEAYTTN